MTKYVHSEQLLLFSLIIYTFFVSCNGQSQCFTPKIGTALTFYANAKTTSIRSSPISQLNCNGGNGCKYSDDVKVVQCSCSGIDGYGNAQWKCESNLPNTLELGTALVSCEGCTSSTDTAKLAGSCGLYYTLNYNANGDFTDDTTITNDDNDGRAAVVFLEILFGLLAIVAVISFCVMCFDHTQRRYQSYQRLPLSHDSFREVEAVPVTTTADPIIPSAPPVHTTHIKPQPVVYQSYQNSQPYTQSYVQPRHDNGFLNGMIIGEAIGNKHGNNRLAQDMLLMNAMNGSSGSNSFTTGLLVGESMSSGRGGHHGGKPPVHNKQSSHGGGHHGEKHSSVAFGGSMTR